MAKRILIPIPSKDFDPTESAIPWKILTVSGVETTFATPNGMSAECDHRMLRGSGLGPLKTILSANGTARQAYDEMKASTSFKNPIKWIDIEPEKFDGVILPGGHAPGMREYLESAILQKCVSKFFNLGRPLGAICHGVVLAARSRRSDQKSSLFGKKTTALLASQEMSAWLLTCAWLGNYYRTYPQTVEAEIKTSLKDKKDFLKGPTPFLRDDPKHLSRGFIVRDKNYLSARWPGDAHLFGTTFLEMLG